MAIALTFLLLGGGAYVVDTLTPHDPDGWVDIWHHPPFHERLADA